MIETNLEMTDKIGYLLLKKGIIDTQILEKSLQILNSGNELNSLDNSKPNKSTKSTSEFSKPIVNQKYKTLGDDIMKNYAENEEDSFKPLNTKNKKTN